MLFSNVYGAAYIHAYLKKDRRYSIIHLCCISTEHVFFRRKFPMRVRFFFWLLFILTCVSVLTFAFLFQRDVPALVQLSLDQPSPKVQQVVTLSLHLTDSGGVPIDNASVVSHANMTAMD